MLRLEKLTFRRPLAWFGDRMPALRDVLIFASVTISVASAVAFFGLRLLKSGHAAELGLPDITSARCAPPEPAQRSPEHHSAVDRATHP
jgi:hypothetical protein